MTRMMWGTTLGNLHIDIVIIYLDIGLVKSTFKFEYHHYRYFVIILDSGIINYR